MPINRIVCPASNGPLSPASNGPLNRGDILPVRLPAGTVLTRFRSASGGTGELRPENSFNPNLKGDPAIATSGARFNPFTNSAGNRVPTLYAADSHEAAALESVFHQLPHSPDPKSTRTQIENWECLTLRTLRDVHVVSLTNPELRQFRVPGREDSLLESELIHSPPSQYPATRGWAKVVHDCAEDCDGLVWRPRLAASGKAYVFFGDRCGAEAFEIFATAIKVTDAGEFAKVAAVAARAHIVIVDGNG